ncbi:hypothetical protein [Neisseria sp.]|uniref:hypothetical protein n=1 Tax=Neisseria sp. TaxID=192066 RepID=UPI0026DCBBAA|nr:hypothetical protein [Neisseria sp.]MDO4907998.1 hypothetical protein [Neisseria sp.]
MRAITPAENPTLSRRLFAATKPVFAARLGREPTTEVLHAGLECGLMQQHLTDVEMISFGPTIEGAHTVGTCGNRHGGRMLGNFVGNIGKRRLMPIETV